MASARASRFKELLDSPSGLDEILDSLAESQKGLIPEALIWFEKIYSEAKSGILWGKIHSEIGEIVEGFVWGSLLGTVFDFFKGMVIAPKGKRLNGGLSYAQKNGVFHHGPVVAAHVAVLNLFATVLPSNLKLLFAATFAAVRYIRTKSVVDAELSALNGFLLAVAVIKMVGDPFEHTKLGSYCDNN